MSRFLPRPYAWYILGVGLLAAAGPVRAAEPSAMGLWMRGDGLARVRIAPCGPDLCAINVWVKNPQGSEKVGDRLVLEVAGPRSHLHGTAYDPKRHISMSFDMKVQARHMETEGCLLGGLLCRSMNWTRLPG